MALKDQIVTLYPETMDAGSDVKISPVPIIIENAVVGRKGELVKRNGLESYTTADADEPHLCNFREHVMMYGEKVMLADEQGDEELVEVCDLYQQSLEIHNFRERLSSIGHSVHDGTNWILSSETEGTRVISDSGLVLASSTFGGRIVRWEDPELTIIIKLNSSSSRLEYIRVSNGVATISDATVINAGGVSASEGMFDACAAGGFLAIVHRDTSNNVELALWEYGVGWSAETVKAAGASDWQAATVWQRGSDEFFYIAYYEQTVKGGAGKVYVTGYDTDSETFAFVEAEVMSALELLEPCVGMSAVYAGAGECSYLYVNTHTLSLTNLAENCNAPSVMYAYITDAGVIGTPAVLRYGVNVLSKPYWSTDDGTWYVPLLHPGYQEWTTIGDDKEARGGGTDSYCCVIRHDEDAPTSQPIVARFLCGQCDMTLTVAQWSADAGMIFQAPPATYFHDDGGSTSAMITARRSRRRQDMDAVRWGWQMTSGGLMSAERDTSAEYTDGWFTIAIVTPTMEKSAVDAGPGLVMIPGACPTMFDGQRVFEDGFCGYPYELYGVSNNYAGAGGLANASTYGYQAVWNYTDRAGNVFYSAPSRLCQVTISGASDDSAIVHIPNPSVSFDYTAIRIDLYRTQADLPELRKLTSFAATFARSVSYTDLGLGPQDDTMLRNNGLIYTTAASEDAGPCVPYRAHCIHQNQHFVVNDEAPSEEIHYSQYMARDLGVRRNEERVIVLPASGGRIHALASIGNVLVAFKENETYAITGTGLDGNGAGSGYSIPVKVSPVRGCSDQRLVAQLDGGRVLFDSGLGICSIDSQAAIDVNFGDKVRYHYDTTTLARAVVVPEKNRVLFLPKAVIVDVNGDRVTDRQSAIVYDYKYDAWCLFTNYSAKDADVIGNVLYIATVAFTDIDDIVVREGSGYVDQLDASHKVVIRARWGWVSAQDPSGVQLLRGLIVNGRILGEDATLGIKVAYDDPTWVDSDTFLCDTLQMDPVSTEFGAMSAASLGKSMMVRYANSVHECGRFMVELYESDAEETQGFAITNLSALIAVESGPKRLDAARELT